MRRVLLLVGKHGSTGDPFVSKIFQILLAHFASPSGYRPHNEAYRSMS